jgi:chorismate--pyruvate lyase
LRNKPLGAVLFADKSTQRVLSEVARITPRHALYHAATANLMDKPSEIWGRRAIYRYAQQPILVNEIFLPAIPER